MIVSAVDFFFELDLFFLKSLFLFAHTSSNGTTILGRGESELPGVDVVSFMCCSPSVII